MAQENSTPVEKFMMAGWDVLGIEGEVSKDTAALQDVIMCIMNSHFAYRMDEVAKVIRFHFPESFNEPPPNMICEN